MKTMQIINSNVKTTKTYISNALQAPGFIRWLITQNLFD